MKQPPDIPDSLAAFALATTGNYPDRYARILDEAFTRYQLMLPASTLRSLANGGSFTTAQAAVDHFREKLHKALAAKIEFGPEIPPAIAAKLSTAVGDIWAECKRLASADLLDHRERADRDVREARERERQAIAACNEQAAAHEEALRQRDAQIIGIEAEKRSLIGELEEVRAQLRQMTSRADTAAQEARDLRERVRELGADVERQRAETERERAAGKHALEEARAAADEMRKGLLLQLDNTRTQAKKEVEAIAKKYDTLVAEASGREAQLAAQAERLAAAAAAITSRDAQLQALQLSVTAKDEALARLTAGFERSADSMAAMQRSLTHTQSVLSKIQAWARNPNGERAELLALLDLSA